MTCDSVRKLIPLYYYGELTPEEEDRRRSTSTSAPPARVRWSRQRALAAALDRRKMEPPASLLAECRADLVAAVRRRGRGTGAAPWRLLLDAAGATLAGLGRWRQPLGAVALIAVGFFAAGWCPLRHSAPGPLGPFGRGVCHRALRAAG